MKKQHFGAVALMTLSGLFAAQTAQAVPVALELALLVDVSGSVDGNEYNLQKTGYVNAFNDVNIQNAIANLTGGIAVTYIEWSSQNLQSQLVGWTHITNAASSSAFASAINGTSRAFFGNTGPGSAINFATPLFSNNGFEGGRWVIDVSGDGEQNVGDNTAAARDAFLAVASGTEGLTKTINGLAIGDSALTTWYNNNIKGGSNAFVTQSANFADFENAVKTKIGREITNTVPEPTSLALLSIGMLGLGLRARKAK